jgi:hypothetical protein
MVYVVQSYWAPEDGDRSSLRNVVVFLSPTYHKTMDKVQNKPNSSELVLFIFVRQVNADVLFYVA